MELRRRGAAARSGRRLAASFDRYFPLSAYPIYPLATGNVEQNAVNGQAANLNYRGLTGTWQQQLGAELPLPRVGVLRDRHALDQGRLPGRGRLHPETQSTCS